MTSQKSSANMHSAKYDLKIAFKSNIGAAVFTTLMMVYKFIITVYDQLCYFSAETTQKWIDNARSSATMLLHTRTTSYSTGILCLLCGALFALASFRYIMKKKQVNLFYSFSVTRRTMFINRLIASFTYMILILFITIGADAAINIFFFAHPAFIIKNALIMLFISLVYMMLGFAVFAFALSSCPTLIEGLFFGGGLMVLPTLVLCCFDTLCNTFLNGWGRTSVFEAYNVYEPLKMSESNIITHLANYNPLLFAKKIGDVGISDNIYSRVCSYTDTSANIKDFGYKPIEMSYITPSLLWAGITVLTVIAAGYIFVRRKAEKAGSYGQTKIASALVSLEAGIAVASISAYIITAHILNYNNIIISFVLMAVIAILAYYIALCISRKKIKHAGKTLAVPCCAAAVLVLCSGILYSGGLNYTNYVPAAEEIENVYIDGLIANPAMDEVHWKYFYDDLDPVTSPVETTLALTDKEDIKIFSEVVKDIIPRRTSDMIANRDIRIRYDLKNGKTICRKFNRYDESMAYNLLTLTKTKAYREELEYILLDETIHPYSSSSPLYSRLAKISDTFSSYPSDWEYKYPINSGKSYIASLDGHDKVEIENNNALRQALLKDLLNDDLQKRFTPEEKPLFRLLFQTDSEAVYTEEYVTDRCVGYNIYSYMTNTIHCIKQSGKYDSVAKELRTPQKAYITKYSDSETFGYNDGYQVLSASVNYYDKNHDENANWATQSFDLSFGDKPAITDKSRIQELISASRPYGLADCNDIYLVLLEYPGKQIYYTTFIPSDHVPKWALSNQALSETEQKS